MIQHRCVPALHILLSEGADEREDPHWPLASPVVRHVAKEPVACTQTSSEDCRLWSIVQPSGEPPSDPPEVALYPFDERRGQDLGDVLVVGQ